MVEVRLLTIDFPRLTLGAGRFETRQAALDSARAWCRAQFHSCQVEVDGEIIARLDSYGGDLPLVDCPVSETTMEFGEYSMDAKLISSNKAARLMAAVLAVTNESGPFPDYFVRDPDGGWGWCGYFAGHIHCFPVGRQWDLDLDSLPARVGRAVLSVLPELGEDPEEPNFVWMPDSEHPFRMPMRPKGVPVSGSLRRPERCWKSHRNSQHR